MKEFGDPKKVFINADYAPLYFTFKLGDFQFLWTTKLFVKVEFNKT